MSGIVGIINLDGSPADAQLLARMTHSMRFRGPDADEVWVQGGAGLGHTLLKTTEGAESEIQPFTLDQRAWIVADARLDARDQLVTELDRAGEQAKLTAADSELLMRAYRVWGPACVEHLLGDFAFGIWDVERRRLFCARDHLGVKSLFYTLRGGTVVFSNTLDCVRMHPAVSSGLNDLAIADFLLFGLNQAPATTAFVDVQRLPPAHSIMWEPGVRQVRRYWTLPVDEPVHFKRSADYVDRFNELLQCAVQDRLRTNRVGIFMSGGLDSPALASVSSRILRARGVSNGVRAFTTTIEGLDQDEGRYARLAAERMRIPISVRDLTSSFVDPLWATRRIHTPSPLREVTSLVPDREAYSEMFEHSRVAFYGEGPDNALAYEWRPYVQRMVEKRRIARLGADLVRHMVAHRRIPLLSTVPRMLRNRIGADSWQESYPAWIEPSLDARLGLRDRWERYQQPSPPGGVHPWRPAAYRSFEGPEWEALFRGYDADETGSALEVRHPYLDLRLLRYMLALPAMPWCRSKLILRRAMRHQLPRPLLRRRKSPLTADPDYVSVARIGLPPLDSAPELCRFVDVRRVPGIEDSGMIGFRTDFRARALGFWLTNLSATRNQIATNTQEREHAVEAVAG